MFAHCKTLSFLGWTIAIDHGRFWLQVHSPWRRGPKSIQYRHLCRSTSFQRNPCENILETLILVYNVHPTFNKPDLRLICQDWTLGKQLHTKQQSAKHTLKTFELHTALVYPLIPCFLNSLKFNPHQGSHNPDKTSLSLCRKQARAFKRDTNNLYSQQTNTVGAELTSKW